MANLFQSVRKITQHSNVVIDNGIFSLHYGVTAFILVLFSILVLCHRPGETITCLQENVVPHKFLNAFCQLSPTSKWINVWQQENLEHGSVVYNEKYSANRHSYFQVDDEWFSLLLLFQTLLFIAPRYFWKFMESGRVEILVTLLYNNGNSREQNIKQLADIVLMSAKKNKKYLMSYFGAELINALNVSLCIIILGMFFDRPPRNAVDVIEFADIDWSPCWKGFCSVGHNFPKLTQCTINRYTSSGYVLSQQAAMILPTDILYQKMNTFLLYWFYMVGFLSYLVLCYRMFLIISPTLRVKALKMRCRNVNSADLVLIIRALGIENWFLINLLSKNIDPETFSDSTVILANKIRSDMNNYVPESDVFAY
ncbi:Innexin inx2 [Araneus ventricosus]|uniref:Innexin n=1 Tax=Araneus ventricosus TaxID=182803 RepID=A0A4Y2GZL9_ARAVE|nr:Innexin inx2 [Araneus ventricosus]